MSDQIIENCLGYNSLNLKLFFLLLTRRWQRWAARISVWVCM